MVDTIYLYMRAVSLSVSVWGVLHAVGMHLVKCACRSPWLIRMSMLFIVGREQTITFVLFAFACSSAVSQVSCPLEAKSRASNVCLFSSSHPIKKYLLMISVREYYLTNIA